MIVDNIENLNKYKGFVAGIEDVIAFLEKNDLADYPCGKHILNDDVYVNLQEYNTKNEEDAIPEAHRKYIDVQIMACGNEKMGYSDYSLMLPQIEYNPETDLEFVKGDVEYLIATPQNFFIFFPNDAHKPAIKIGSKEKVKKAIFKLRVK